MIPVVLVFLVGCLLTAWFLWPLLANFSSALTSASDGLLIGWTVDWVSRALSTGQNVFQAPFLFPYPNTLAFSQLFISTGIINLPLHWLGLDIISQQNFHFLAGSLAMFLCMYLFVKAITNSQMAGLFSAAIFVFSPFHLEFVVHLHAYLLAGLPLLGLGIWGVLTEKKPKKTWLWCGLIAVSFLYQALNDPLTAYFCAAILVVVFAAWWMSKKSNYFKHLQLNWPKLAVALISSLFLMLVIYLPYIQTSMSFAYARSIREAAHFSYSINKFFQLEVWFYLLLIWGLWQNRTKNFARNNVWLVSACGLVIVGLILMLGPVLKVNDQTVKLGSMAIPLPYAVFYYLIPGFQAFRAATRWLLLASFGLAWLLGMLMARSKFSSTTKVLIVVLTIASMHFQSKDLTKVYTVTTDLPKIYQQVEKTDQKVLVEFPIMHWDMAPFSDLESERLRYQSQHQKVLFNGITGFTPPDRIDEIVWLWHNFPNQSAIEMLKLQGVEMILVHFDQYQQMSDLGYTYDSRAAANPAEIRTILETNLSPRLQKQVCIDQKCLYIIK